MSCKIGITTDPEARQAYWKDQAIGLTNWQILDTFRSKTAAKEYETQYALRHGCKTALSDSDALGKAKESATEYDWWYVYHFDYVTEIA
jgi:hypothetical protein